MEQEIKIVNYQFSPSEKVLNPKSNLFSLVERLKTFADSPVLLDVNNLANAGLYYVRENKTIKCIYCDIEIFDFESNDLLHHECCGSTTESSTDSGIDSDNILEHSIVNRK